PKRKPFGPCPFHHYFLFSWFDNTNTTHIMKSYPLSPRILFLLLLSLAVLSCNGKKEAPGEENEQEQPNPQTPPPYTGDLPIGRLNLPQGFSVDVYAEGIDGARSMAMGEDGSIFVGTRNENKFYALSAEDGDHRAEKGY